MCSVPCDRKIVVPQNDLADIMSYFVLETNYCGALQFKVRRSPQAYVNFPEAG